jgi:hypothetical protein
MRYIIISIMFSFLFSSISYSQTNLIKNPNAELDEKEWKLAGEATVENNNSGNKIFTIRNGGSFWQDVELPKEIAGKFALLIGRGSSERINVDGQITGLPYLYGFLFSSKESNGAQINTYLTGQKLRANVSNTNQWVAIYGIFEIPEKTVSARIFLNQAERKGLPQNGSAANFDDLGFFIFDTKEEALEFANKYD